MTCFCSPYMVCFRSFAAYVRTEKAACCVRTYAAKTPEFSFIGVLLAKCQVDSLPKSEGQNDPLKNRTSCPSGRLARCRSAEDAVLCPSDMMLCVISYRVLSGAKRRQIQQLRCCVLPRQAVETEECLSEINTTQRTSRDPRHL